MHSIITTRAPTVWNFDAEYAKLPRDPYVQNIGVGRFRAYSKYRYYFPGTQGAIPGEGLTDGGAEEGGAEEGFYRAVGHAASPGVLVEVPDKKFNQSLKFAGRGQGKGEEVGGAGPGRHCSPRHPTQFEPWFLSRMSSYDEA